VGGTIDIGAFELQTVTTPESPGDYNGNHSVDAADYVIWRKTRDTDVPQYSGADGNGSSRVDDADYDVWRGNFGGGSPASAAVAGTELISRAAESTPGSLSTQRSDRAIAVLLGAHVGTTLLSETRTHNLARKISCEARDEALLAILAELHDGRPSRGDASQHGSSRATHGSGPSDSNMSSPSNDSIVDFDLTALCEPLS
jgi:hypothetical protein